LLDSGEAGQRSDWRARPRASEQTGGAAPRRCSGLCRSCCPPLRHGQAGARGGTAAGRVGMGVRLGGGRTCVEHAFCACVENTCSEDAQPSRPDCRHITGLARAEPGDSGSRRQFRSAWTSGGTRQSGASAEFSVALWSAGAPRRRAALDGERRPADNTGSLYCRYGVIAQKSAPAAFTRRPTRAGGSAWR